jgi:hypothetical protein
MKVKELIEKLQKFDLEITVLVKDVCKYKNIK